MTESNFDGLPDIIKNLASSPEIAEIIKNAGLASPKSSDTAAPAASAEPSQPDGMSIPPDLMAKLPLIVSALKDSGIVDEMRSSSGTPAASNRQPDMNEIAEKLPQVMSALTGTGSGDTKPHTHDSKNRKALLCALKPYMSDRKRSAIDAILNVDSMAEILMMMMGGEH